MDFLVGNPFSTPVGQRIERATSPSLQAEDWGLNMEICDIINETDEGPKDAVKALKKRIAGNRNSREVMLALTVLETCVKNCGHRFHVLVSSREFVEGVLVRAILPKYNPPMVLHDRVLSLIQAWADAFRSTPDLGGVVTVYDDLRKRGLEFPMTDLDTLSPIHTPHRSVPDTETPVSVSAVPITQSSAPAPSAHQVPAHTSGPITLTPAQAQKLTADLEVVRGNQAVMSDMLNQLNPADIQQADTDLLQQLYSVCRSMQERVVELIPQLADEGLVEELLTVNDGLNTAFLSYHRFERLLKSQNTTEQQSNPSLIDFSDQPSALTEPAPLPASPASQPISQSAVSSSTNPQPLLSADDEFDMFAQTRGSSLAEQRKSVRYEDPGAVEGLAGALDTKLQVTGGIPASQASVMDDIEKWLSADLKEEPNDSEGVTSEEFDKFLEERAKAADRLPSQAEALPTTNQQQQKSQKQERVNDQLFAL